MYWTKSSFLGITRNGLTEEQSCTDYVVFVIRHRFLLEERFLITHIDVKGYPVLSLQGKCVWLSSAQKAVFGNSRDNKPSSDAEDGSE